MFYPGATKTISTLKQVHLITLADGSRFWDLWDIQTETTGNGLKTVIKSIQKLPMK